MPWQALGQAAGHSWRVSGFYERSHPPVNHNAINMMNGRRVGEVLRSVSQAICMHVGGQA